MAKKKKPGFFKKYRKIFSCILFELVFLSFFAMVLYSTSPPYMKGTQKIDVTVKDTFREPISKGPDRYGIYTNQGKFYFRSETNNKYSPKELIEVIEEGQELSLISNFLTPG